MKERSNRYIAGRKYYQKNKDKILANNIATTKKQRVAAFKVIANGEKIECCKNKEWNCCGDKTNQDYLSFDHKDGNGFAHRKEIGEGSKQLTLWIIKNPELARKSLQIICMNAQIIKCRLNRENRIEITNKPQWGEDNIGTPLK